MIMIIIMMIVLITIIIINNPNHITRPKIIDFQNKAYDNSNKDFKKVLY